MGKETLRKKKVSMNGLDIGSYVDSIDDGLKRKNVEKGKSVVRYYIRAKDTVVPSEPPKNQ